MAAAGQPDLLVVGAGMGGVAAALAALERGLTVTMTEEYRWVGGQVSVQGTPPDEHPWIEEIGCTRSYRSFRDRSREHYRSRFDLTPAARAQERLNPGNATVSKLSLRPDVAQAVLLDMLSPWISSGRLELHLETRLVRADSDADRVTAAEFERLDGSRFTVAAPYVIDATELGDVIDIAGIEHVTGAESQDETGEPHAPDRADPDNVQAFSWAFALEYEPGADHTIDRPAGYDAWRAYRPAFWPGDYLSFDYPDPRTLAPTTGEFHPDGDGPADIVDADQSRDPGSRNLWVYRRIQWRHHFREPARDITVVNWPMTDYLDGPLFGRPEPELEHHRRASRELGLSYLYWLQTESPRPDGGTGWTGLRLSSEAMGTADGFAMGPYVRESRRLRALRTVVEQDVSLAVRGDRGATRFDDSVGIGAYRIDLHPSTGGDTYIDVASAPFQIPLGALVPQRVRNVLAGAKNIGTTHITNGCYRLHPVEWNIGESAGALVAFCLARQVPPHAVAEQPGLIAEFQADLQRGGVELAWPDHVRGY